MSTTLTYPRPASTLRRPLRELWLQTVVRFTPAKGKVANAASVAAVARVTCVAAGNDPAREAANLRAMAWALPSAEGGHKADLLAAADRHERLHPRR